MVGRLWVPQCLRLTFIEQNQNLPTTVGIAANLCRSRIVIYKSNPMSILSLNARWEPLTSFERRCWNNPSSPGVISDLYQDILNPKGESKVPYMLAWEKDLGNAPDKADWEMIWEAVCTISRNIQTLENAYKLLFCWYITPSRLSKMSVRVPTMLHGM